MLRGHLHQLDEHGYSAHVAACCAQLTCQCLKERHSQLYWQVDKALVNDKRSVLAFKSRCELILRQEEEEWMQ